MYKINIEQIWNILINYSMNCMPNEDDSEYKNYINKSNELLEKTAKFMEAAKYVGEHYYPFNEKEIRILVLASALHDIPGRNYLYSLYGSWEDNACPEDHGDIAYEILSEYDYAALKRICSDLDDYDCLIISNVIKYHCKSNEDRDGIYVSPFIKDILQILISVEYMLNHQEDEAVEKEK